MSSTYADVVKTSTMSTDDEVFVYMGEGGARAPQNVVRVRVDPSVALIPANI
jgi:hypothetical protein